MNEIKRAKRLSQALVHFVTARASLLPDQRMSSLPIRAKYKHIKTICERTFDNSPTVPAPPPQSDDHPSKELKLCTTVLSFYSPARKIFHGTFPHAFSNRMTTRQFLRDVSPTLAIFQLLQHKYVIRIFSVLVNNSFVRHAFTLSASQIQVVKK